MIPGWHQSDNDYAYQNFGSTLFQLYEPRLYAIIRCILASQLKFLFAKLPNKQHEQKFDYKSRRARNGGCVIVAVK